MVDLVGVTRRVLDCVEAALTVPVCTVCPTAGQAAIDGCCDTDGGCGGQLTGHVVSVFDADGRTGARTTPRMGRCRPGTVGATLQVILARCVPTVDDRGRPPDCATLAGNADGFDRDLSELWTALLCCDVVATVTGVEVTGPPAGGCVLAVATVTVLVD